MDRAPMTPEGFEKLKKEIENIKNFERPANIKAIDEARQNGDLSENADYDAAKNEQGLIDARLKRAEDAVARAEVIDPTSLTGPDIKFGATVTIEDLDSEEHITYKIVGLLEADIKKNTISLESPIAKSLIGKEEGDEVTVRVPGGSRKFGIVRVEYK